MNDDRLPWWAWAAFIDQLLPPEPVIQIPGQLALDGTEEL